MDPENSIKRDLMQRQLEVMEKLDPIKIEPINAEHKQPELPNDYGSYDKPAIPSAISPEQKQFDQNPPVPPQGEP